MESTAPLRIEVVPNSTPLMRVWAENGTNLALSSLMSRPRMPYFSLASTTMERPSGVSSASEASCAASASSCSLDAAQGLELGRLAVAERDGAGLVEQQRVDVAGRFDGAAGHGQHVEAHETVHAGDADGRQQRADGGRDQRDEQRHQHDDGDGAARVGRVARDGRRGEHEDDGEPDEQDVERDLVGRLLPLGALDQPDHAVEEGGAGRRGDAHADPVGQHLGAAGHGRAVAAGLADDGGRLAGDGRLVDRGDALDHLAVGGDDVAGLDQHDVADLQAGAGHELVVLRVGRGQQLGLRLRALAPQRVGLRLAAALGHGLREVGEQHGEPQPER